MASLPPLSGGLLWFYRTLAASLAVGVGYVLLASLADAAVHPAITGLRLAKGIILLGVAGILSWRRQRDPVAALLSLAFLTRAITSSVDFVSTDLVPVILDRVRFLLFALALLLFPDGDWQPRWTRHVAIASVAVVPLLSRATKPNPIDSVSRAVASIRSTSCSASSTQT